jgi:hypothetical protein
LVKLRQSSHTTSLASSINPSVAGNSVTITASTVHPNAGGTITFMNDTASLGTVAVVDGVASLAVNLAAGVHKITAFHSLDNKISIALYQRVNGK